MGGGPHQWHEAVQDRETRKCVSKSKPAVLLLGRAAAAGDRDDHGGLTTGSLSCKGVPAAGGLLETKAGVLVNRGQRS